MVNLNKLLESLKDVPEELPEKEVYLPKIGNQVITVYIENPTHISKMRQFDGKKGVITAINEHGNLYFVHGWWWIIDSLKPIK